MTAKGAALKVFNDSRRSVREARLNAVQHQNVNK